MGLELVDGLIRLEVAEGLALGLRTRRQPRWFSSTEALRRPGLVTRGRRFVWTPARRRVYVIEPRDRGREIVVVTTLVRGMRGREEA